MFSTSLEPEIENEQGDGAIVSFHLSDSFLRKVRFLSIHIPYKTSDRGFVVNAPSSTPLYD